MKTVLKHVLQDLRDRRTLAATALIAFCVALSGPFSTYTAFGFWDRAMYWGLVIFAALPTSMTLRHLLFRAGYREGSLGYALWMVPSMALIYGTFVWIVSHNYPRIDMTLVPSYPVLLLLVGMVALIVVLARRIYAQNAEASLRASMQAAAQTAAAPAERVETGGDVASPLRKAPTEADVPPRLMRRLPETARGPIHRMEARNHFVRVVTSATVHEIRLRFADAVAEMDGVPGVCAHRSHWVRLASVLAAERDGVRLFLVMEDGARVPVSRGYRDRVEAVGLITPKMLAAASAMERLAAQ